MWLHLCTLQSHYTKDYDAVHPEEKKLSRTCVKMPRGFQKEGKVLRLNKALCGFKSAPIAFFTFLKENLEAIGFDK